MISKESYQSIQDVATSDRETALNIKNTYLHCDWTTANLSSTCAACCCIAMGTSFSVSSKVLFQ